MNLAERIVWALIACGVAYVVGAGVYGYATTPPFGTAPAVYCTMDQTSVPC